LATSKKCAIKLSRRVVAARAFATTRDSHQAGRFMSNSEPNNHYYEPAVPSLGLIEGTIIVMIVGAMAVVQWLDDQPLQVLGWILFPIEFPLNAVFFPGADTHVRKNGAALLEALPILLLGYVLYRLAKGALSVLRRVLPKRPQ
jgi:4-amino-4-deoxy-L-arabinose transferase-like glycosyltransferase